MEQIDLVKVLLKNTYINFLLGAGTSYNNVDGKANFPLMRDLLNYIKENKKVIEFYNSLRKADKCSVRGRNNDSWFV